MIHDIVVVGGGIAGLMAAIEAKTASNKVAIVTKGNLFRSNSSLASGGINAVLDQNDKQAIQLHIDDTLKSGYGLCDKKSVEFMCQNAGAIVKKLLSYGVEFDSDKDGNILQRSFGGGSSKRTCYVGDKTGASITAALIKKAKSVGVEFIVNTFVLNIAKINKSVSGIVAIRRFDSSVVVYPSKAVILAGGGYAGIYRGFSTNGQDFSGDMHAIALRAGLVLKDMEFVQFHPTGMAKSTYLVSEAARGEGGYLVNSDGVRFVDELDTRDKVSFAISNQIRNGKKVYIDLRHIPKDHIELKLPSLYKAAYNQAGIDISSELLEIKPVAHYTMGGIENSMTKTSIDGLFVSGECANIGVHGANRLGGNSLLEGAVFGDLAGSLAKEYAKNSEYLPIDFNIVARDQKIVDNIFDLDTTKNFNAMRITLGRVMFDKVGIIRDKKELEGVFDYLKYLRRQAGNLHTIDKGRNNNVELISILELRNALEIAETIVLTALKRDESRGAHKRVEFENQNETLEKPILINEIEKGFFNIWFEDNSLLNKIRKIFLNRIN